MSEIAFEPNEMLRPIGEIYDDLRQRAGDMIGRIGTRMGFSETTVVYAAESGDADDNSTAEMADDEEKKDDNGNGNGNGNGGGQEQQGGHDPAKCTATVCSACGKGGGGNYFSAVPRKPKP